METLVTAIIGALGGGVGLKVLEKLLDHALTRPDKRFDQGKAIRDELRTDNKSLREAVDGLEKEVDNWQKKYYDLYEKHLALISDYRMAVADGEMLRKRVGELQAQLNPTKEV